MSTPSTYHIPVMLPQVIEGLAIKPDGTYVDLTFGGGGHSHAILHHLGPHGQLIALDQDSEAAREAATINDPRFLFIQANFRSISHLLAFHEIKEVDGILADLGTSSHQLNTASRGFANRIDGPLDMRMDPAAPSSATDLLNKWSEADLKTAFKKYGELKQASLLASIVYRAARIAPITTTTQLKEIVAPMHPKAPQQILRKSLPSHPHPRQR